MRVLTIGKDNKLFEKESPVLSRNIDYARSMEELHVVAFTLKKDGFKNIEESVGAKITNQKNKKVSRRNQAAQS